MRHDDLLGPVDCRLRVVALDKPSWVRSTRLSGSVKLRCALGSGSFEGGRGGPERLRFSALRLSCAGRSASAFAAAAAAASTSSASRSRILAKRFCLSAIQERDLDPSTHGVRKGDHCDAQPDPRMLIEEIVMSLEN